MKTIRSVNDGLELLKKHYDNQLKVAEDSGIANDVLWVKMKYQHSLDVFKVSKYLIENDPVLSKIDEKYKIYGELGAILHDIGRAYKIGENRQKVEPHGAYGADKILKEVEKIDDPFILIPIKYHDELYAEEEARQELLNYNLTDEEKEIIILLLKVVMDSDKLANFELYKTLNEKFFLGLPDKPYFTQKCLDSFKKRQLVIREDRETIFDQILFYATWVYGLNFDASIKFILEHDSMKEFMKMLNNKVAVIEKNEDPKDVEKVKKQIEEIRQQFINDKLI